MAKKPVPKYDLKAFGAAIKAARTGRKESRKKVSDEMFISLLKPFSDRELPGRVIFLIRGVNQSLI